MQLDAADLAATDDDQKLAILECMLLAVFADGSLTQPEMRKFETIVESLPWGMERSALIATLQATQQQMSSLSTPQAITNFVAGIAQRLTPQPLREKVLYTMGVLAESDGALHQFEKNILGLTLIAFNITSDRLAEIKAAVEAARPAPPTPAPPPDDLN